MISCNLKGGLGNQIFQIFATIVYALKRGDRFIFTDKKTLQIGHERKTYWDDFLFSLKCFTKNINYNEYHLLRYNEHHHVILKNYNVSNIILDGYFQSYKYFAEYENTLFSMIRLREQQKMICKEFAELLESGRSGRIVSIHFRLGDYKHSQDCHNVLSVDYYKEAILKIAEKYENIPLKILYFCENEDNKIVEEYIKIISLENTEFVKVPDEIPDWKQMLIMSCCDDNIIANSTFSWWGAYFPNPDGNVERTVYYPNEWFGPKLSMNRTEDMFPASWIRIPS